MPSSNALDPQSPLARAIYDLGIVSSIVFALIFVIVTGAITFSIFRFRSRAGEPDPGQPEGDNRLDDHSVSDRHLPFRHNAWRDESCRSAAGSFAQLSDNGSPV